MTDITDQDRRDILEWASHYTGTTQNHTPLAKVARYVLATVDAPAPTLSEEWRDMLEKQDAGGVVSFSGLLARAEQMERDLAEARAEVEALAEDLAGAKSEVERLTAERDRLEAAQRISDGSAWGGPVREPCTESQDETVTAPSVHNTDRLTEHSDATVTDPADVKPGEAWQVLIDGIEPTVGFSANGTGWCCYRSTHGTVLPIGDERITLVSRLVPAPRVITNPDELERLAATSIIRDGRGWPGGITDQGELMRLNGVVLDPVELLRLGPVTVLWEPEA